VLNKGKGDGGEQTHLPVFRLGSEREERAAWVRRPRSLWDESRFDRRSGPGPDDRTIGTVHRDYDRTKYLSCQEFSDRFWFRKKTISNTDNKKAYSQAA
jgi:hypothetical protein